MTITFNQKLGSDRSISQLFGLYLRLFFFPQMICQQTRRTKEEVGSGCKVGDNRPFVVGSGIGYT